MCGRYGLTAFPSALIGRLGGRSRAGGAFVPRYNIAPTQQLLCRLNDEERRVAELRWGLVPPWAASPAAMKLSTFNARIETIATAPAFRDALRVRRCAVFASGYYEWQRRADGTKRPFWISRRDGEAFAFAGLWSTWGRGAEALYSCTIVTQPPNDFLRTIHSRMPVDLHETAAFEWLDAREREPQEMIALLPPQPSEAWTAHEVSARVGNVRSDDPALIEPVARDDSSG